MKHDPTKDGRGIRRKRSMSSLLRYKKSGGFNQLLSLIEAFGSQKKQKFLEMIETESGVWANALREKMLSVDRIFTWPDQVVVEVFKALPAKNMAYALQGLRDEQRTRVTQFFSASENRRITDVLTEGQPKPEEIAATLAKLVEVARKMINDKVLYPEKFDVGLIIPEDIEGKLELGSYKPASGADAQAAVAAEAHAVQATAAVEKANGGGGPKSAATAPGQNAEVIQLQRSLATILKENKGLKEEVRALKDKLEQIRKIA